MKTDFDMKDIEAMADALQHCIAYMEHKQLADCGLFDDRDCSPYNDAKQALKTYMVKNIKHEIKRGTK